MRFALDQAPFLERSDGGAHRLRSDGLGAREIGGRCRAVLGEAPHDHGFAPGKLVRGRRRTHAAHQKPNGVNKIGNVGVESSSRHANDRSEWQLNLQVYLARLAGKSDWQFG